MPGILLVYTYTDMDTLCMYIYSFTVESEGIRSTKQQRPYKEGVREVLETDDGGSHLNPGREATPPVTRTFPLSSLRQSDAHWTRKYQHRRSHTHTTHNTHTHTHTHTHTQSYNSSAPNSQTCTEKALSIIT